MIRTNFLYRTFCYDRSGTFHLLTLCRILTNYFMQEKQCLNCGHTISENYCPHCGQRTDVHRITWGHFAEEAVHTITHGERSILFTTWKLISQPGLTLSEYLSGKRRKYHSPVGFFLIWVTLSVLIHRGVIAMSGFHPVILKGLTFSNPESIQVFIVHGQWFYVLSFPIVAALFYILLARPIYSYIECLVITMYVFSITYVFFILCYLIGGLLFGLNVLHWAFYLFQVLLSMGYTVFVLYQLFRKQPVRYLWLRIFLYMFSGIFILKFMEWLSDLWVILFQH